MNDTIEVGSAPTSAGPSIVVDVDKLDTAQPLAVIFQPYQTVLEKWEAKAQSLIVTDIGQKAEMKIAREARLELKATRCALENRRRELVENLKARTGKIDLAARMVRTKIEALEEKLLASEEFAERYAAQVKAELKTKREAEINPFRDVPLLGDISDLSESDYQIALADAKLLRQTKIDAATKAQADHVAKIEADRIERERITAENARLKAEADAATKRLEAERKAREEETRKEREAQDAERKRIEAERKAEREKAEAEKRAIEEKAKAERLAAEAKARKEREIIEYSAKEAARKAKVEADKLKAELDAKARAEAKAKADEAARVEAERKAKESAERRAAAAPDRSKLEAYLLALNALPLPALVNKKFSATVKVERDAFAGRIEQLIIALTETPASKELL